MKPPYLVSLIIAFVSGFLVLLILLSQGHAFTLLAPSGSVGRAERDLMLHATYLMLIVVVPVVLLAVFVAWHYREENETAIYTPKWEHSKMEELIWWSIPFEIVLVLAALTWSSTHALDPAKALAASTPPYVVDVVALPWRWLFLYPEDGVASLNELDIPAGRPIEFHITADAPMNSFWVPALGGQMYAMTGMETVLHLMASTPGTYDGRSANYSGVGFAQMSFAVRAQSQSDFATWVVHAKTSPDALSTTTYAALREPSDTGPVRYYGSVSMGFEDIVHAYMPMDGMSGMHHH